MLPYALWGFAIAGSIPVEWILPQYHAVDSVYLFASNLWQGRTKIRVDKTKYICACIHKCVINISYIALTLCSTSWTKLRRNMKPASSAGWQTMSDGGYSESNECRIDFINQWSIFHSYLSYTIEVSLVNNLHNFSGCKLKLALLNWLSRQQLNMKGTLNLPHECFWGI